MVGDTYRDSIHIDAAPEVVFEYFTDPAALAEWMGDSAEVDPRPGGAFVVHFGENSVEGEYLEVARPKRVVISWGRRGSPTFPSGASVLSVTLEAEGAGTRVEIEHRGLPRAELERHRAGWTHYFSRLRLAAGGEVVPAHHNPPELSAGAD